MRLVFASILFLGFFGQFGSADDQQPQQVKTQAPADYYDGGGFEQSPYDQNKPARSPSGELPYSDDEIKQNAPENYKNMPVDQD